MSKEIKYRYAERKDAALILYFVKELAKYEKGCHIQIIKEGDLFSQVYCVSQ